MSYNATKILYQAFNEYYMSIEINIEYLVTHVHT